jgi:hypothetical protein
MLDAMCMGNAKRGKGRGEAEERGGQKDKECEAGGTSSHHPCAHTPVQSATPPSSR